MAEIKTIYKGESITLLFTFPALYDMARLTTQKVFVGETEFAGVKDGQTVKLQLKSSDTDRMIGTHRIVCWIDDVILGLRKPYCGELVVAKTQASGSTASISNISDIIIPIVISETEIDVGDILYNYIKGEKGDPFLYSDFTPEQIAELQQPATDAIASIQAVEQSVEQAEALRVTAEQDRQTNTATAIQNAETATTNAGNAATLANEKAGLADTKATLADQKATLADAAATNANTKAGLADAAATNANNVANTYASELAAKELKANKQNSLAVDGTGTKFPTVDAVNNLFNLINAKLAELEGNTAIKANMVIDGHSYVDNTTINPKSYLGSILPYSINTVGTVPNYGLGGSNLPHLLDNAATVDSKLVTEAGNVRNVLVIYSLNVSDSEGSGISNYNSYKQYLIARANAGWKVFVYTLAAGLQSTMGAQWITEKDIFNNLMRTNLILNKNIFVLDTETIPESLDKSKTDYFYDGIHPTEWLGYLFMKLFQTKAAEVFGSLIIPKYDIPSANVVARYVSDDLTTITKDSSNQVSVWKDKYLSGRDLLQGTATKQPIWSSDGILFVDDALKASFTFNQPETIYIVFKQLSWAITNHIIDGVVSNSGSLSQTTVSPSLRAYSGVNESSNNTKLPLNTFGIVKVIFNGANSKIKIGITNTLSFNGGTTGMGGIILGSLNNMTSRFSNIQVKELICINSTNTVEEEVSVLEYLKNKYSI